MPDVDEDTAQEPLRVSILRHGGHLVASFHTALDDGQLVRFRRSSSSRSAGTGPMG